MGMARAWLYAGTPSVVGSLWGVAEGSTSQLMTAFYRHWEGGNCSKVRTLQKAQVEWLHGCRSAKRRLRNSSEEAYGWREAWHPYYRSPFILIGDPV